jgi:hypothetical protein
LTALDEKMKRAMRAKMKVVNVHPFTDSERLTLAAVGKDGVYPEGGESEDNTFARYTPQADLTMLINNPDLVGKFEAGQVFYVDFTPAEVAA